MDKKSSSKGISFSGVLQIVFIVLKLCHIIDWKWVWVLAPTWIDIIIAIVLAIIYFFAKVHQK